MKHNIIPYILVYIAVDIAVILGVSAVDGKSAAVWMASTPLYTLAYALYGVGAVMALRKLIFRIRLNGSLKKSGADRHFVFPVKVNYVFNHNTIALLFSILILLASFFGDRTNIFFSLLLLVTAFMPMTKLIYRVDGRKYYMDDVRFSPIFVSEIQDARKSNYTVLTLFCNEQKDKRVNFPIPTIYMRVINDL